VVYLRQFVLMQIFLSLCALTLVLLVFSLADSILLESLGLTTQYSRVFHAFIAAFFALENWCLYLLPAPPNPAQDEIIAILVAKNSSLERQRLQMKSLGKSKSFHMMPYPTTADPHQRAVSR
jgi:hypothetical protein